MLNKINIDLNNELNQYSQKNINNNSNKFNSNYKIKKEYKSLSNKNNKDVESIEEMNKIISRNNMYKSKSINRDMNKMDQITNNISEIKSNEIFDNAKED